MIKSTSETVNRRLSKGVLFCTLVILHLFTACTPGNPDPTAAVPGETCYEGTISKPYQLSPNKSTWLQNPWTPFDWGYPDPCTPQSYFIQLAQDPNFAQVVIEDQFTGASSHWHLLDPLTAGVEYFWRVAAEVGNTRGPFSETASFVMGPFCDEESALVPVAPADGSVINTNPPTFRWENTGNCAQPIEEFYVEIPGYVQECISDTLRWTPPDPLQDCMQYQWLFGYDVFTDEDPGFEGGTMEGPDQFCYTPENVQSTTFFLDTTGTCRTDVLDTAPPTALEDLPPIVQVLDDTPCLATSDEGLSMVSILEAGELGFITEEDEDSGWITAAFLGHEVLCCIPQKEFKPYLDGIASEVIGGLGSIPFAGGAIAGAQEDEPVSYHDALIALYETIQDEIEDDTSFSEGTLGEWSDDWIVKIPPCPSSKTLAYVDIETNCRTGPGAEYPKKDAVRVGEFTEVAGRHEVWNFLFVKSLRIPNSFCWIWGEHAHVIGDISGLPIVIPDLPPLEAPEEPRGEPPPGPKPTCEPGKPCN